MQDINFWNKLHIHRLKVILVLLLTCCVMAGQAQQMQKEKWARRNNPNYDNRKITYGFLIGIHTNSYQVKYSDKFADMDTLHSVIPSWSSGFSLGFIVNYKLTDYLDFRITPKVAFYEHNLTYRFTDDTPDKQELIESTMVEFPILLKYKSERRGNIRMYMVGGIKPTIEASGKNKEDEAGNLKVKGTNLCLEAGFGFDLYYPLFKFSPEIRFSRGITNMLGNATNPYNDPLTRINTNTVTLYLLFQ